MSNLTSDYRTLLRDEFSRRHAINPNYSQRAYARDLKISQGRLSEILSGKQGLSQERALSIAQKLGFNREETEYFRDAVASEHGRSDLERASAQARLKRKVLDHQRVKMLEDTFRIISDWYHLGILELAKLKRFKLQPKWIAKALRISEVEAKTAIERLERLNLIKRVNGKSEIVDVEMQLAGDIPSESIRTFHRQILQRALQSIDMQTIEEREINSVLIAINAENLGVLKKKIQNFSVEMADKTVSKADALYCYSQQLFRIDHQA